MNVSRRWLEAFLRRPLDAAGRGAADWRCSARPVDAIEPLHPGLEQVVVGAGPRGAAPPERRPAPALRRGRRQRHRAPRGLRRAQRGGRQEVPLRAGRLDAARGPHARAAEDPRRGLRGDALLGARARPRPGARRHPRARRPTPRRARPSSTRCRWPTSGWWWTSRRTAPTCSATRASRGSSPSRSAPPSACPWCRRPPARTCRRRSAAGAAAVTGGVRVAIEDAEGCPRFLGAVLRGVRVGPSPEWLRARLEAVGVRSINNVVDATNYVMFELNQPMHAYDVSPARRARRSSSGARGPARSWTTLDGVERALAPSMTVIADAAARHRRGRRDGRGALGGRPPTRPTSSSSAPTSSRARARHAPGARPEHRGQLPLRARGGPVERARGPAPVPSRSSRPPRAARSTASRWTSSRRSTHPPRIFLRPARVAQVLGVEVPWDAIERYLVAIGATVVSKPEDGRIAVDVPGWRPDLVAEIDLIEEIARLHGYDNFPTELRPFRVGRAAQRARPRPSTARCAAGWWPRGCSRSRRCRWGRTPGRRACGY